MPRALDPRILRVTLPDGTPEIRTAADLARSVNLSTSWFRQIFTSQIGRPPSQWILERRLQTAATLLERTDLRIKEVAYHVGYRHPASFVRAFRRSLGVSPGVYRGPDS